MGKQFIDTNFWKLTSNVRMLENYDMSYVESWVEFACQYFILIRTYMGVSLSEAEVDAIKAVHVPLVSVDEISFSNLKIVINSYLSLRDTDGWRVAQTFIGIPPNNGFVIYADNSQNQNLNLLPSTNSWTPLSINGVTKAYLTPEWGNVSGVVSSTSFNDMITKTSLLYPDQTTYENEMNEVFTVTNNLTDEQKMTAEFWAGGPNTITPPGMFVYFTDVIIRSNQLDLMDEIKYYAVICSGLFQASICAWRLKRIFLQARPIQKLRQFKYNTAISQAWNNQILGQYWLPYQETNFVTPPFPDFVSGHSTFGTTFARLIDYLQGSDQIVLKNPIINNDITALLTPILNANTYVNFSMNNVFIFPKTSQVQTNVVPASSVILKWSTWSDVCVSCGLSRIYGGIHVQSSNTAGNYLGRMIGDHIWDLLKNI